MDNKHLIFTVDCGQFNSMLTHLAQGKILAMTTIRKIILNQKLDVLSNGELVFCKQ